MSSSPNTRPSLLVRIRDGADREAWRQFVELYAPLVYRFARRRGLQDADAADLTQEVLQAVARNSERIECEPGRGQFRAWLFTVARNKMLTFLKRSQRHPVESLNHVNGHAEPLAPAADEQADWDQEYETRMFAWAAEKVRGQFQRTTWDAFWLTAVEGIPAREVAGRTGLTIGAVYIAKSRVLARLREQVRSVKDEVER